MNKQQIMALATREVNSADMEAKGATLATFTAISDLLDVTEQHQHGDIYAMLMNATSNAGQLGKCDGIILRTCGWAAPVTDDENEDDVMPSVHPKRRRVALVIVAPVNATYMVSALRFGDDDDVIIQDTSRDGGPRGELPKALAIFMDELNRVQYGE